MKPSGIGGQAVLEGVMMKNKETYAVAVRKPDKQIIVEKKEFHGIAEKYPFLGWIFIRGVVNFVESMILGVRTLTFSASFYEEEDQSEPSEFEKKLISMMGEKAEAVMMGCTVAVSILLAVAIFMLLPFWVASLLEKVVTSPAVLTLIEGLIRITIFIGYVLAISMMKDIRRVFMYHGAEHKSINCIEHGLPLTVENVKQQSTRHKRCGTSFMLFVIILSALFFMFIRVDNMWLRMLFRVLLIPVIAGVSYELIKLAGKSENQVIELLSKPGLWLQGLTTREPDEEMIEVAIQSVEAVFDWKSFLEEDTEDTTFAEEAEISLEATQAAEAKEESEEVRESEEIGEPEESETVEAEREAEVEEEVRTIEAESESKAKRAEAESELEEAQVIEAESEAEEVRVTEAKSESEAKGTEAEFESEEIQVIETESESKTERIETAKGIEKVKAVKEENKEKIQERNETESEEKSAKKTGWKQETAELQAVEEIETLPEQRMRREIAATKEKPVQKRATRPAGTRTSVPKTSPAGEPGQTSGNTSTEAAATAGNAPARRPVARKTTGNPPASRPVPARTTPTRTAETENVVKKPAATRKPADTVQRPATGRPLETGAKKQEQTKQEQTEGRKPAAPGTAANVASGEAVAARRAPAPKAAKPQTERPVRRQVKKEEISPEQIEEKKENLVKRARPEPTIRRNPATKPSMMKPIEEEDDEILNALDHFFGQKKEENQEDKSRAGAGRR